MLYGEIESWWKYTRQPVSTIEGIIAWNMFKTKFLANYFPSFLHKKKTREFLELKQGNMSVGEYTTKFNELLKYWPHYQNGGDEEAIC
uniref:Retrotransposon gag domain-containing protein n=1 Tax=Cajanus cajan TaxID=3821 RepID=A0A151SS61_CAJCA|nr:hypothetical protein KK1_003898 [Cajanus cajan]